MNYRTSVRIGLMLAFLQLVLISCNNDDDGNNTTFVERDRTEQQLADKDSLLNYLSTHYYNASFFETGENHSYSDIEITLLEEGETVPEGSRLLIDDVETRTTNYIETDYEYYILNLNQGGGESPKFTDQVRVSYEGYLETTGEVFDSSATPLLIEMETDGFSGGVIRAWKLILPEFGTSTGFTTNNGVVNFEDFGLGVMFIPSGLAYFSSARPGIPSYSNLIFKFDLLQFETDDHDNDGIPSYIEDLNSNIDVFDDDTNGDDLPNYLDTDDDGDGTLTRNELVPTTYTVNTNMGDTEPVLDANEFEVNRVDNDGIITIETVKYIDSDNNGIFDHLDENISINYSSN